MSVARGMGQNGGRLYSNITKPVKVDLSFIVDSANANGLGVSSLKSNGYVRNVFMHTSQTAGSNDGVLNPNPAVGYALVQLKNNFNIYLGCQASIASPTTGGTSGSVTNHNAEVIATLGTTTLAQWQAAGLPAGLVPAVGQSFIAIKTGAIGGTGTVIAAGVSGISSIEVVGNPNLSLANSSIAVNGGAYLLLQFLKQSVTMNSYTPAGTNSAPALTMNSYTPAGTNDASSPPIFTGTPAVLTGSVAAPAFTGTPAVLTGSVSLAPGAPLDNSVVSMSAWFDASSVTIDGL